jgi:hypothetical protein
MAEGVGGNEDTEGIKERKTGVRELSPTRRRDLGMK